MTPTRTRRQAKLPDGLDLGRLCRAVERDRRELLPFRRNRTEMVRQYGGMRYGDNAAAAEVPVNLLGLYVEVITQALVDQAPRVMLSTFDQDRAAVVEAMQEWVNDELVRMAVPETYRRAVYDALFCVGVVKVALATPVDAALEAWDVQAGQPFIEPIDLDDFACDTTARQFSRCAYHACRYRLPTALANELYAKGRAEKFDPSDRDDTNAGGDERIHTLSASGGRKETLEDETDLWEVFLPRHKLVVTLRDNNGLPDDAHGPVRVQPWVGPSCGPYHFLGFGVVPGNLMPKAPVMDLYPLHLGANNAYRKLMRRTRDSKVVNTFDGRATDDADRFKKAQDGEFIQVSDVKAVGQLESGGPTNDLVVMFDHFRSMFSLRGGNLEVIGGRSTEARTLGQEKMLNENAGTGIAALTAAVQAFVTDTTAALLWYFHHHPTKVMESHYAPASMPDLRVTRTVTPAMRQGLPPHLKIDPYSLGRQTPQSRLAFINQTVQSVAPLMQLAAQQGKLPDVDALLAMYAKYGNEPDLVRIFGIASPPDPGNGGSTGGGAGADGAAKPAQTERTYNRVSSGGGQNDRAQQLAVNVSRMDGPANPNGGMAA